MKNLLLVVLLSVIRSVALSQATPEGPHPESAPLPANRPAVEYKLSHKLLLDTTDDTNRQLSEYSKDGWLIEEVLRLEGVGNGNTIVLLLKRTTPYCGDPAEEKWFPANDGGSPPSDGGAGLTPVKPGKSGAEATRTPYFPSSNEEFRQPR